MNQLTNFKFDNIIYCIIFPIHKSEVFMSRIFNQLLSIAIFFTIFICLIFIPTFNTATSTSPNTHIVDFTEDGKLLWPSPGYTKINSYFGKRTAPANGASTYHKGIDIGAPQGSNFVAVTSGQITFVGFFGGGGYTITLTDENNIKYSYCHCDSKFIVKEGDLVEKGQIIGCVGPKYVYGVKGNKYTDKNRCTY